MQIHHCILSNNVSVRQKREVKLYLFILNILKTLTNYKYMNAINFNFRHDVKRINYS